MDWTVVIPSARAENLVPAVKSVLRAHPGMDPGCIIIVDDGARAGAERQLPDGIRWVEGVKPFVYARNVNRGVSAARRENIVIMGDDVEVITPRGFDYLAACVRERSDVGVLSPGIDGIVGNPRQRYAPSKPFIEEYDVLCFVCVMIPRRAWDAIGELDERFIGYGCEDCDYCWRALEANHRLGVFNGCVVKHDGSLPSTFRTRQDINKIHTENMQRLRKKWERRLRATPGGTRVSRDLADIHKAALRLMRDDPVRYDHRMSSILSRDEYEGALGRLQDHASLGYYIYLNSLVRVMEPKKILELGTADGAASLFMLLAMGPEGELITIDRRAETPRNLEFVLSDRRLKLFKGDDSDLASYHGWDLVGVDLLLPGPEKKYLPVLNQWRLYEPFLGPNGIAVFKDIHLNGQMERFWTHLPCTKIDTCFSIHRTGVGIAQL